MCGSATRRRKRSCTRFDGDFAESYWSRHGRYQRPRLGGCSVCVVLAADGYPDAPKTGDAITGIAGSGSDRGHSISRRHRNNGMIDLVTAAAGY